KTFRARERAHIAIAPLLDTPYNRGKSSVKLFDIAALGAVGIYTKSPPYEDVIEHSVNGLLLDNDPLLWRKALKWMIDHPNELQRMAHACQALAASRGDLARLQAHWRRSLGGSVSHV